MKMTYIWKMEKKTTKKQQKKQKKTKILQIFHTGIVTTHDGVCGNSIKNE